MPRLPVLSGKEVIKILVKNGFQIVGRKGSHIRLKKRGGREVFIVVVPDHEEIPLEH